MTLVDSPLNPDATFAPRLAPPTSAPAFVGDQASQLRDLVRQHEAAAARATATPSPTAPSALPPTPAASPVVRSTKRARVIAITSGKGGVGKTNLAVNLAARFAQAGKSVVLLDADMGLANADVLCGLDLRLNLAHVIARRAKLADVIADAPGGFKLIGGASGLARMADLPESEHRRLLEALAELERSCDLILIDTGAGISPNVLSFTRAADHVLVVTTPEPTAIADAYATIKVIAREQNDFGRDGREISLLVNEVRSATEARGVHERVSKVVHNFLGLTLGDAGFLPLDPAVGRAVRMRTPFLLHSPRCAASVCVTRLAMRLEAGMGVPVPSTPTSPGRDSGFFGLLSRMLNGRPEGVVAM